MKLSEMPYDDLKDLLCVDSYWNASGMSYSSRADIPLVFLVCAEVMRRRVSVVWPKASLAWLRELWGIQGRPSLSAALGMGWSALRHVAGCCALPVDARPGHSQRFWRSLSIVGLGRVEKYASEEMECALTFADQLMASVWVEIDRGAYADVECMFELCCMLRDFVHGVVQFPVALRGLRVERFSYDAGGLLQWARSVVAEHGASQAFETELLAFYDAHALTRSEVMIWMYKHRKTDALRETVRACGGALHAVVGHAILVGSGHPIVGELARVGEFCAARLREMGDGAYPRPASLFCAFLVDYEMRRRAASSAWFESSVSLQFSGRSIKWRKFKEVRMVEHGLNEWCVVANGGGGSLHPEGRFSFPGALARYVELSGMSRFIPIGHTGE